MLVRLAQSVLQKLAHHSERAVTCRCFCSLYKDSTTGKGQSAAEDTQVPAQHEKLQWEEKVDKFMSNLSEKHLLEKKQLELEIKMMSQMNASVPEEISPVDWMILLTECESAYKKRNYIEYLHKKETIRLKKWKDKKLKGETLQKTWSNYNSSIYYGMSREKQINKWKSLQALQSDINVIIDFGFDIGIQAQRCVYHHLELLLMENRNHVQPLNIHVTSAEKNFRLKNIEHCQYKAYVHLHKKNFWDIFPHKDLVYLSPDGPPMKEFNPNRTYIFGGIGDFDDEKDMTLELAINHGLQCASFPIKDYFCGPKSYNLRIHQAFSILLDLYLHMSWKEAFIRNLPSEYTFRPDVVTLDDIVLRQRLSSKVNTDKIIRLLNSNNSA